MKKIMTIRLLSVILCAACLLSLAGGIAESGAGGEAELLEKLRTIPDFKFQNHTKGIGAGVCAVYMAPSTAAYRVGKAACDLSGEVDEAGFINGWLLIRYTTNAGQVRVGYIYGEELVDFKSSMTGIKGDPVPLTAAAAVTVKEAPSEKTGTLCTLGAGDTFWVLRKYTYTGSWYYIECSIDGKTARGFIDRNEALYWPGAGVDPASGAKAYDLASLGYPATSPRGTGVIGHFEVSPGERKRVREKPGDSDRITVAYPDRYYACYDEAQDGKGNTWYYIWVEEDSLWGWIAASTGKLVKD